jgi:hypothetical protein
MRLIVDLDGTICSEEKTYSRSLAKSHKGARETLNKLYKDGHTIIIYSARTWMEYEMTVDWLSKNGFNYHQLIMGKPIGDHWIDDRAIAFSSWEKTAKLLAKKEKKKNVKKTK